MGIAILAAVLAAGAASPCEPLEPAKLEKLLTAAEVLGTPEAAVRLLEYWRATCKSDRGAASRAEVVELARGLETSSSSRSVISAMLLDVGPNVVAAKPYLEVAITNDRLAYAEAANENHGVVFNGNFHYRSMMCLKRKIKTGARDPFYCHWLKEAGLTH